MPYITQVEAEANVTGFSDKTQSEKDRMILDAGIFISNKCVPEYLDVTKVPDRIKQAVYEAIRGIEAGQLFNGTTQQLTESRVKAGDVEVQEKFVDGSIQQNKYEQRIDMLIDKYANCVGNNRARVSFLRRF